MNTTEHMHHTAPANDAARRQGGAGAPTRLQLARAILGAYTPAGRVYVLAMVTAFAHAILSAARTLGADPSAARREAAGVALNHTITGMERAGAIPALAALWWGSTPHDVVELLLSGGPFALTITAGAAGEFLEDLRALEEEDPVDTAARRETAAREGESSHAAMVEGPSQDTEDRADATTSGEPRLLRFDVPADDGATLEEEVLVADVVRAVSVAVAADGRRAHPALYGLALAVASLSVEPDPGIRAMEATAAGMYCAELAREELGRGVGDDAAALSPERHRVAARWVHLLQLLLPIARGASAG